MAVEANETISINDRLAGEVFQMIKEGLSNVRRDTNAQSVRAVLMQTDGKLIVQIENETPIGFAKVSFHPRSLADRAAAPGGELTVERTPNSSTVVIIQIPL